MIIVKDQWTSMRVTPPLLVRNIQGCLGGTQYAKDRYAVRKNPVLSYADINFNVFKRPIFIKKHKKRDIQSQLSLFFSRARFARAVWGHFIFFM